VTYGRGSVLIGPSDEDLCEAQAHGSFVDAVRSRDFEAMGVEAEERARAFTQAQQLLRAAEWIALGRSVPDRRTRN